jgi:small-conductance mechanosensitive channel
MANANAIRTGIVLAVTVGIGYTACAVVFWLWPEAAATFMNGLFHGLDFRKLQSGPALFSFGSFFYALVALMVWVFALGAIYGWLQNRFGNQA